MNKLLFFHTLSEISLDSRKFVSLLVFPNSCHPCCCSLLVLGLCTVSLSRTSSFLQTCWLHLSIILSVVIFCRIASLGLDKDTKQDCSLQSLTAGPHFLQRNICPHRPCIKLKSNCLHGQFCALNHCALQKRGSGKCEKLCFLDVFSHSGVPSSDKMWHYFDKM